jgi:acetyl esterase/lipase
MGLSAGAHLAMLAHLARDLAPLEPDLPAELRDVPEDARRDRALRAVRPRGGRRAARILSPSSASAWAIPRVHLASPVHHAAAATAPILLIHGTGDTVVSWRESQRMHDALVTAGRAVELLLLDGAPHAFQVEWRGEANRRANETMDAFLGRLLTREAAA